MGTIKYFTDQSSTYSAPSLVDGGYVTGITSSIISGVITIENNYISGATNGLTKADKDVILGGALTGDTALTGAHTLSICSGAKLNTDSGYQISGTTVFRASPSTLGSIHIGYGANGCGSNNIALGTYALSANTTGCKNIAMGDCSMNTNTTGCHSIGIGSQTLSSATAGGNIAVGLETMKSLTTGTCNIGLGVCAMNIGVITGSYNIGFGTNVLSNLTSGRHNIGLGYNTLTSNTVGCNNIGVGQRVLTSVVDGCSNVGVGNNSLNGLVDGCHNTALGECAGYSNVNGDGNVFIGYYAGSGETSSDKLHIANTGAKTLIYGDFASDIVTIPTLCLCTAPVSGVTTDGV